MGALFGYEGGGGGGEGGTIQTEIQAKSASGEKSSFW